VTTRKKITKKPQPPATAISDPSIGKLTVAAVLGDRAARDKLRSYPGPPPDFLEQVIRAWDNRPIELKRLEAKATAEPNSQFAHSYRHLEEQFGMLELMEILRIAQEKRKKGGQTKETTRRIYAEFDQCEKTGAPHATVARAKRYGISQAYLQTLHERYMKKKLNSTTR
jgi:hypothetical protein